MLHQLSPFFTYRIRHDDPGLISPDSAHQSQAAWTPQAVPALWVAIDEEHAGTLEDPIPYTPPMEIFKDKYYTQDGVTYLCTRDSETPLSYNMTELVGLYVEVV